MVAARGAGPIRHALVRDLPELLDPGDLLVVNDTRVLAVRLLGRRRSGAAVEVLLAERRGPARWRALVQPAGRLKPGEEVELEEGRFVATLLERPVLESGEPGDWILELRGAADSSQDLDQLLEAHGRMPLPPYIVRERSGDPRN